MGDPHMNPCRHRLTASPRGGAGHSKSRLLIRLNRKRFIGNNPAATASGAARTSPDQIPTVFTMDNGSASLTIGGRLPAVSLPNPIMDVLALP